MGSSEFVDPYLDPATGILRNRVGAKTQAELDAAEADLTAARLLQLLDHPPEPSGDLAELQDIHLRLFADLYEWAGECRTVDLRKAVEGAEFFLPVSMIEESAAYAAAELRRDGMLRSLPRDAFVERLAHHYDQFNYIHPFREGNGRTQRFFWSRVARDAGWQLDWSSVRGEANDAASRVASEDRDFGPLHAMFDAIVTPGTPRSRRGRVWRSEEAARLSAPSV
jgi:cell filamentation protein